MYQYGGLTLILHCFSDRSHCKVSVIITLEASQYGERIYMTEKTVIHYENSLTPCHFELYGKDMNNL